MAELYVFFTAMAPVVELRGALPLGVALGLPVWEAFFWSVLGNLLVVPVLLTLLPWAVRELEHLPPFKRAWDALEARVRLKGEAKVQRYGALGLFLFVALPLPGTGAWTGSVLAVVLGVKKRYALPAISAGVITAGALVALASAGVLEGLRFLVR